MTRLNGMDILLCMNDENYADGKKPEEIEE